MSPKYGQKVLKLLLQLLLLLLQLFLSGWLAAAAIELGRSVGWSHADEAGTWSSGTEHPQQEVPRRWGSQSEARRGKAG